MSIILSILLWILLVLVTILGLIILVPIHTMAAGAVSPNTLDGSFAVKWAWGFISFRGSVIKGMAFCIFGIPVYRIKWDKLKDEEKKEKKHKEKKKSNRGFWWFVGNRRTLAKMVARLIKTFSPRLRIEGVVGLGDPADAALFAEILRQVQWRVPAADLRIQVDYLEEIIDLEGEARITIWPIRTLLVALMFLIMPSTRAVIFPKAKPINTEVG